MSIPEVQSRSRLLAFLKKFFAEKSSTSKAAPTDASYLTLGTNGDLSAERVLTAGDNITFTDGGAGGTLTIDSSGGAGGGDVSVSGTPSNNEVPTWTNATTIKGEGNLTFDGSTLTVTGDATISGDLTVDGGDITLGAATSYIKDASGHNRIQISDTGVLQLNDATGTQELFVSNGYVFVTGELWCNGNIIRDNGGNSAITFDGSGNTTLAGDLTVDGANGIKLGAGTSYIKDASGHSRISMIDAGEMILRDSGGGTELGISNGYVTVYNDLRVDDFARIDALRVGTTNTDPGDGNLYVEGDITVAGGDITLGAATSYIKDASGHNRIQISDTGVLQLNDATGTQELFVSNGYVFVTGELWCNGNTIRDGGGNSAITFDGSGNTTLAADLTVNGATILHSNAAARLMVRDTTANYQVALGITDSGGGPGIDFGDSDSTDNAFMSIGSWSSDNNIDTKTRDFHLFGTNTTTGLYFDESEGKFGIGNTAPQAELHISGIDGAPQVRLSDTDAVTDQAAVAYTEYWRGDATARIGWVGYGSAVNENFTIQNETSAGSFTVTTDSTTALTIDSNQDTTLSGDLTVTGGDITLGAATSYIKDASGHNRIQISDTGVLQLNDATGTQELFVSNGYVFVTGELWCNGNTIRDNGGNSAITFDGSGNTTLAGDLTVTGGDITLGAATSYIRDAGGQVRISFPDTGATVLQDANGVGRLTVGTTAITVHHDLYVLGNDIADSGYGVAISFDGSQNTTVTGDLTVGGTNKGTGLRAEFLDSGNGTYAASLGAYWESSNAHNVTADAILKAVDSNNGQLYDIIGPSATATYLYHYVTTATGAGGTATTKRRQASLQSNPFTGQHPVEPVDEDLLDNREDYVGLIVCSTGDYKRWDEIAQKWETGKEGVTINEALPRVALSSTPQDKSAFGVVSNRPNEYVINPDTGEYENDEDGVAIGFHDIKPNQIRVNSLGEGAVWVCNISGNLENGDYITTCELPGLGMKQADDLLHNYTVAKITQDCDFRINASNYSVVEFEHSGSTYRKAFVGCTYHCG